MMMSCTTWCIGTHKACRRLSRHLSICRQLKTTINYAVVSWTGNLLKQIERAIPTTSSRNAAQHQGHALLPTMMRNLNTLATSL